MVDGGGYFPEDDLHQDAAWFLMDGMMLLGTDAVGVGDRDLRWGLAYLRENVKRSKLPVTCANLVEKSTGKLVFAPYVGAQKGGVKVGLVGMRVDARTRSAHELERFLSGFALPVLAHLRDTQLYVQLAARGMTLFDLSASAAWRDLEQWQPLLDWFAPTPLSAALD